MSDSFIEELNFSSFQMLISLLSNLLFSIQIKTVNHGKIGYHAYSYNIWL